MPKRSVAVPCRRAGPARLGVAGRGKAAGELPGSQFSGRFWQSRFYDFNLCGQQKEIEKLKYMHRNPVVRGLVASPEDWRSRSYRSYAYGEAGTGSVSGLALAGEYNQFGRVVSVGCGPGV